MRHYVIVIEQTPMGYLAYAPELLGCVATGHDIAETSKRMREAIVFHIGGLRQAGEPIPSADLDLRSVRGR